MARYLSQALGDVPDDVVPLSDKPFGEENTLALIADAASGPPPNANRVEAARELLSGPPKAEARKLVEFLMGGRFIFAAGK